MHSNSSEQSRQSRIGSQQTAKQELQQKQQPEPNSKVELGEGCPQQPGPTDHKESELQQQPEQEQEPEKQMASCSPTLSPSSGQRLRPVVELPIPESSPDLTTDGISPLEPEEEDKDEQDDESENERDDKEWDMPSQIRMLKESHAGCWSGFTTCISQACGNLLRFKGLNDDREKYEQIITFLASVPIFKRRLPRSELPKVAQMLKETEWQPDETVVKQGDRGTTFYLIYSGSARVVFTDKEGEEHESAILSAGDWIGGQALVADKAYMASVFVQGFEPLVTLSMSKEVFQESGLKKRLRLPKRPAMRTGPEGEGAGDASPLSPRKRTGKRRSLPVGVLPGMPLPEHLQDFIISAMGHNPNLRAFCEESSESIGALKQMVAKAECITVEAGESLAKLGDLGHEFFIIFKGSVEVIVDSSAYTLKGGGRSAEEAFAAFSMAERLRRKQHFLLRLHEHVVDTRRTGRAVSVLMADPRERKRNHPGITRKRTVSITPAMQNLVDGAHLQEQVDSPKEPMLRIRSNGTPAGPRVLSTLREGDSFGELSLLYNMRREATFTASEKSQLFVLNRRTFKQFAGRDNGRRRFKEQCALLDEVDPLTPLLRSERIELASMALGYVTFRPGERVLTQGKPRQHPTWYVVSSGKAITSQGEGDNLVRLSELTRGSHFGERALLRAANTGGPCISEVHIDAGQEGLVCLRFDGELITQIFRCLQNAQAHLLPSETCDLGEWEKRKVARCNCALEVQLKDIRPVSLLGCGAFGRVFLVEDSSAKQYALKAVSKGHAWNQGTCVSLCWERDLLSMLDSNFIVRLFKTYKDSQYVYFLMEAALGGDLYRLIHDHCELFTDDSPRGSSAAFYTGCVIAALEHMHERKIIYRDLKPENIMLDTQGYGKVCDMGLARFVVGKTNTQAGTPDYMAPEIIDPPHYHDSSADWWSLGVLMFEMFKQELPFAADDLEDAGARLIAIRQSQEQRNLNFGFHVTGPAQSLVKQLLTKLPGRLGARGGAPEVRQHHFFQRTIDFGALHSQTLPSPMARPFVQSESCTEEFPWLAEGSSSSQQANDDWLFVPYEMHGEDWDKDF